MAKIKQNECFNFTDHDFPDLKLEKCLITDYDPSQTDTISSGKSYIFIIVKDGKGTVASSEKRTTITKGSGIVIKPNENIKLRADSIEPFTLIQIYISGKSIAGVVSTIEKKENSLLLNFDNNNKIPDTAYDLIIECSKTYKNDFGIILCVYDFINSIEEHYMDKKIPTKNVYMTRAVDYIKHNYNKNISVENIANLLGIERSYLSRLFKTYKNKSTQNYIIDYRMNKAKRMFEEEDMNVSQVCAAVGYTNIYCFSRIFKSRVGMPPKEYMERCKKKVL